MQKLRFPVPILLFIVIMAPNRDPFYMGGFILQKYQVQNLKYNKIMLLLLLI